MRTLNIIQTSKFFIKNRAGSRCLALFLGAIMLGSCGGWQEEKWGQMPSYPVFKVAKSDHVGYRSFPARLEGIQEIEIRAKVGGYIQDIYVDEGMFVKAGQTLFRLESNDISQSKAAASAAIKTAEANVNRTKIEVDRLKPLVEKDIISPVQLQTAKANYNSALAQLNQAKSTYKRNEASVAYTTIQSPVDGYVGRINFRQGSLVGPGTPRAITTVSNTSQMFAYFPVSEQELLSLSANVEGASLEERLQGFPKVKLRLADYSEYELTGILETTTGRINPLTGAILLRAKFDNPQGKLLSGSNGAILVPKAYENVIAVPALSTFDVQGMKMIYVLSEGDTLKSRAVQVEDEVGRYYIIKEGLRPGERVLAQGVGKVYPNTVIAPEMASMDSISNSFQLVFK